MTILIFFAVVFATIVLAIVLERIIETGESVLVGYNKCFLENKERK